MRTYEELMLSTVPQNPPKSPGCALLYVYSPLTVSVGTGMPRYCGAEPNAVMIPTIAKKGTEYVPHNR